MQLKPSTFSWRSIGVFLALYLIIVAANGYVFGAGDQVEVLPYALFLQDASLFPSDFYVQYISKAIPNERYFFSGLLALSGQVLPILCGVLHLLCSLLLLGGLYRISSFYIQVEFLRWGVLLAVFLPPLYGINLGGNELYYNTFIPSLLAKSIGIWGFYHYLKRTYHWSILLLALCTFIHPVAGAQLFLLLGGVLLWEKISGKISLSWTKIGALFLTFMLTAGLWVFFLKFNFDKGTIDTALLFEIMEFRVPHHYFPSYFPLKYFILLVPCYALAMYYFIKEDHRLFIFFALALLGCVVYTVGVEILQSTTLLTTQWYKTTIWLKALSVIAIVALVEEKFLWIKNKALEKWSWAGLALLTAVAIIGMSTPFSIFKNKTYQFAWKTPTSGIIDIAIQAKEKTPPDATFVIPIAETAFKYYSQRSCYIDYKTMVHRKDALPIWYQRVREIYGIHLDHRQQQQNIIALANTHYTSRNKAEWESLAKGKFKYLLTSKNNFLDFPVIAENNFYKIYAIP